MSAGKRYMWAVDADSDCVGGMLFARLLTIIDGCVTSDPSRRVTIPHVLDTLTTLQRDVLTTATTISRQGSLGGGSVGCRQNATKPVFWMAWKVLPQRLGKGLIDPTWIK